MRTLLIAAVALASCSAAPDPLYNVRSAPPSHVATFDSLYHIFALCVALRLPVSTQLRHDDMKSEQRATLTHYTRGPDPVLDYEVSFQQQTEHEVLVELRQRPTTNAVLVDATWAMTLRCGNP